MPAAQWPHEDISFVVLFVLCKVIHSYHSLKNWQLLACSSCLFDLLVCCWQKTMLVVSAEFQTQPFQLELAPQRQKKAKQTWIKWTDHNRNHDQEADISGVLETNGCSQISILWKLTFWEPFTKKKRAKFCKEKDRHCLHELSSAEEGVMCPQMWLPLMTTVWQSFMKLNTF